MFTADDKAEIDALYAEAWKGTDKAAIAAFSFRELVEDAVQAQRPWAQVLHDETFERGAAEMAKRYRRRVAAPLYTKKGSVSRIAGAKAATATGMTWVQLTIESMTHEQVQQQLLVQRRNRQGATKNIAALSPVAKLMARHPDADTVADALDAEGISLDELLVQAGAA